MAAVKPPGKTSSKTSQASVSFGTVSIVGENDEPTMERRIQPLIYRRILTKRCAYTYDEVNYYYEFIEPKEDEHGKQFSISRFFPILSALSDCTKSPPVFLKDLAAGLTMASVQIPQGLANGNLACLSPVSGLYQSFFSVTVYMIFGTCPHNSIGTNTIAALVTAAVVEREVRLKWPHIDTTPYKILDAQEQSRLQDELTEQEKYRLCVAMTSTFLCGVIMLAMSILRLGCITNYMPSSFAGGFTMAAAIHIAASQVKLALNVKVPAHSGPGHLLKTFRDISLKLDKANYADAVICIVSVLLLFFLISFLNPFLQRKIGFHLPSNLIIVIIGTLAAKFGKWNENIGVAVVGKIPSGFPRPELPSYHIMINIWWDSIVLTIIVFIMSTSMTQMLARIHGYDVDNNQELIAYGMANLASSFFPGQAASSSLPRSMILSNTRAKTLLHAIPTSVLLLVTFLIAGNVFECLPIAVLAAVILVAIKDFFQQAKHLPQIWSINKVDFFVWIATCLVSTFWDLPEGIAVGILVSAFGVIISNQFVKGTLIVQSTSEDLLLYGENRVGVVSPAGMKIFYFPSQLYYANADRFRRQLFQNVLDPRTSSEMEFELDPQDEDTNISFMEGKNSIRCLILDCSAITYIDVDGVNMLKTTVLMYRRVGVQTLLARCQDSLMDTLDNAEFFAILPRFCVCHDVIDAIRKEDDMRSGISRISLGVNSMGFPDYSIWLN